ncbi:MAG: acyl-CoA dehydratase activase-related protein [Clostridia bacterium]|nr:acyl-CoA dehydratase activase-related protein [Clostridia bacterium]
MDKAFFEEALSIKVGIPGGLLYYRYDTFIHTFFDSLEIECEYSIKKKKKILDMGVKNCVDEACLPMKIYHGHAQNLKNNCDYLYIPRIMTCENNESICPKFCGLPEMVMSGIKRHNNVIDDPIHMKKNHDLVQYFLKIGQALGVKERKTIKAYKNAYNKHQHKIKGIFDEGYQHTVFLGGHPYNIYDSFANMNLIQKLREHQIGIITEERVNRKDKDHELGHLIKKPYWLFFRNNYGASKYLARNAHIDGIVYISSFSCGIDSITIEMMKNNLPNLPFLVLKIDEHTGEAGMNTRIEAFADMLERRRFH